MDKRDDNLVWITVGGLGAMALGIALIPFRSLTSASNLAFVFLAFTIIVAELGGRSAALLTAVVSAMSLNFFLTEPYLTLVINKVDDVVAFLALAGCGLIAAAFGKRRGRWSEAAARAGEELSILNRLVDGLRANKPLTGILSDLTHDFRLGAMVLRDSDGRVVAAAPADRAPEAIPEASLSADTLFPADDTRLQFGLRGLRLPHGGGRLSLGTDRGTVAIDLWEGDTAGLDLNQGRTLAVAASILALEVSRRRADQVR